MRKAFSSEKEGVYNNDLIFSPVVVIVFRAIAVSGLAVFDEFPNEASVSLHNLNLFWRQLRPVRQPSCIESNHNNIKTTWSQCHKWSNKICR